MISRCFKILSVLFCALYCSGARADSSELESRIKRKIFQQCSKAEADVAKISVQEKRDLVPYLGRVLELKLEIPTSLVADAAKIGRTQTLTSTVYPDGSELWKTFDPDHERQAKQCALKILSYIDRSATGEIAKVVRFALSYQEVGAEKEAEEVLATARQILQSGRGQSSPDTERQGLLELLELRAETRSNLVDEFVFQLAPEYPDLLADELLNASRDRRLYAVRLFSRLNIDDREIGNQLLQQYAASEIVVRRDIATVLAAYGLDEIRVRFIQEVSSQLVRGEKLDGEIANSFALAIKSLPKEAFSKLTESDKTNLEKLFLSGKDTVLLEPLFSKLLEAKLVPKDFLREGLRSSNRDTMRVSLQLVDDLVDDRWEFFNELSPLVAIASTEDLTRIFRLITISKVPDAKKAELFSAAIFRWAKLPVEARVNGVAVSAARGLVQTKPSLKLLDRVVVTLNQEVESSLKKNPHSLPAEYRESVQVIGIIGGSAFKLVPKSLAESKVPEIQEALLKGMVSGDNVDRRASAYMKQLYKRGAIPADLLNSFPENVKANIVAK